jgi:hypothetical protein
VFATDACNTQTYAAFDAMAFTFAFAAYNLVRLPKLIVEAG